MDKLPALKPLKLEGNLAETGDVGNKDMSYLWPKSKSHAITSYWGKRTGSV